MKLTKQMPPVSLVNETPLITIIIAVYNGSKTLQQCIDSVVNQTYSNKEIIIIDGGSKDGTVDLLKTNSEHIAYWISEPDRGIYNAWNKGLAQAKGDWIFFLGADDYLWNAQVLAQLAAQLAIIPPNTRVAYSQIMLLSNNGEVMHPIGEPWAKIKERFKQVMCMPHQGVMHSRSLFELHGNFDESFRITGDYELLLRELKTGDAVFIPDLITTGMRQGGISSNPANSVLAMQEIRRAQKIHGGIFPGWVWVAAMIRVYLRLFLWRVLGESVTRRVLDGYRRMMGLPSYWTKT